MVDQLELEGAKQIFTSSNIQLFAYYEARIGVSYNAQDIVIRGILKYVYLVIPNTKIILVQDGGSGQICFFLNNRDLCSATTLAQQPFFSKISPPPQHDTNTWYYHGHLMD
jgi:hypothetical protein